MQRFITLKSNTSQALLKYLPQLFDIGRNVTFGNVFRIGVKVAGWYDPVILPIILYKVVVTFEAVQHIESA